ncbi:MarR family winged helix-turn-helix transcriptional regulator [Chloroflexota bacterium]
MGKNKKLQERYFALWMAMVRAKDAIHNVREEELNEYHISPQQAGIMAYIMAMDNNATPADISRSSFRKANTVTINLNRMEKKGLIIKSRDSERKNVIRVSLTEKGRQIYLKTSSRKSIIEVFSNFTPGQCRQLEILLDMLLNNAAKYLKMNEVQRPKLI